MTTRNITKKIAAVVLALSIAAGMLPLTQATQAQAASISMYGDEILDVENRGVTLTVKNHEYKLLDQLLLKDNNSVWHDNNGTIIVQIINDDLKVANYSLQGEKIKLVTWKKDVKIQKPLTTGEGKETRFTGYISADGEEKSAPTLEEVRALVGTESGSGNGNTNNGTNGGTNQGNGSTSNNGTGNSTNQGNSGGSNNGTGNNNSKNITLVGNNGLVYNDGTNQFILSSTKAVNNWLEINKLVWVRFMDGQISHWNLNKPNPEEVIVVEANKSSSILLQNGIACYYDTNGVLQLLPTTPVNSSTNSTSTTGKISLIGNDAIMYTNGSTQKILSSGKTIDKKLEIGNLFWVRFVDGSVSLWDLNQSDPKEVVVVEKGKSSSIVQQDGKAGYYDTNGVLQPLTTTPVNNTDTQPTNPTNPTTPSTGNTSTATKFTYAYRSDTNGVYTYLYNSKGQVVDKFKLSSGVLTYSGKKINNWKSVRWAKFNKEGNIIVCLKNAKYYSVNHNTLAVKKLGTKANDRNLQRGLITHVIKKNGAKKNVAHK